MGAWLTLAEQLFKLISFGIDLANKSGIMSNEDAQVFRGCILDSQKRIDAARDIRAKARADADAARAAGRVPGAPGDFRD